ncbi:UDP-GlcNAc:betaGal beta-1,3-N-acetylglucosaminyltransferase-like protein 1 [Clupea harengus]|uniref:UDP-GlcNAc:betaGal beta-1,3-N-acetylglucosaminyltransferase-like protein 1 n=1 Tax=Clupea harengus TaxID=7950 RepID=A0A8M1KBV4_CLUHA|nr:UDP-GlcNAc:betaGal beta-1,3-N-acetylglucosaminyltransferase-like protein 1 [Clupea harengus]
MNNSPSVESGEHGAECVPAKRICTGEPREQRAEDSAPSTASNETIEGSNIDVSVIMPVYNASCWLDECLEAVLNQDFTGTMELSVFDDASTDSSRSIIEDWRDRFEKRGIAMVISGHDSDKPKGVGFAKNQAVAQSTGRYLCFQDADDVTMSERVRLQYETSILNPNSVLQVKAFCDVDENKIKKGFYTYEDSKERPKPKIPVSHFKDSCPPYIVCVKLDMTEGVLEENLHSLKLTEGVDYYHFN